MVILIPRAETGARRIIEVLGTRSSVADPERPVAPEQATGEVFLSGVAFAYPRSERPVLRDLSLAARPGRTTAIIGGTGSGKWTVVNLVRAFDATEARCSWRASTHDRGEPALRQSRRDRCRSLAGLRDRAGDLHARHGFYHDLYQSEFAETVGTAAVDFAD